MIKVLIPKMPTVESALPYLKRMEEARWFSNFGQNVRELEDRLSQKYAGAYVVTTSSCTDGLELAYMLAVVMGYRKIELPALTFPATWLAASRCGMEIIPIDVDPHTWIAPGVAGWGVPSYAPIVDAAGAFGEQGVPLIKSGLTAVFSLHATKPLGCGEGGYIVTWDAAAAEEYRAMSQFGIGGQTGLGTNCKMSEYHAAMALAALDQWDREPWLQLYDWYEKYLPAVVTKQRRQRGVYPILSVKLPVGVGGAQGALDAMRERGVECRRWYVPTLDKHKLFAPQERPKQGRMGGHKRPTQAMTIRPLPVTWDLADRLLGLPYHLFLTESDVRQVCETLAEVIEYTVEGKIGVALEQ